MSKEQISRKLEHSPTLNTVLMVEEVLKSSGESALKIADLKRKLPKQINHRMLKVILEYLEESNKIYAGIKGITWIHNESRKMKQALRKGFSYPEDF